MHFARIEDMIRPRIKGFDRDYLKQVISVIASHVRNGEDKDPPLRMEYLRKLVPYAERYLNALIDLEIIIRSPYYVPGQISYRYVFAPEYLSKYKAVPLNNPKLKRRIYQAFSGISKDAVKLIRGQAPQVRYLKQLTLSEGWREVVESFRTAENKYNVILGSAIRLVNGDIFYSRDKTEGRFHSNATTLKRELRPYLRVNGQRLANIDIKNSQPYLSTIILTYPSKVAGMTKNIAFSMLLQSLKVSTNDDVKKYIKLVADGQFYEYLTGEFGKDGIELAEDPDRRRYEVKKQVLRILFAPNRQPKNEINRKCRQTFKKCFPTVHKIFSQVRGRDQGKDPFSNSNRFPILLASIESFLMLDVIMKRIYKELPGVIAITIHDSILTGILTDDIEAVRKIMSDELTKFVGFSPRLKIEDYEKYLREKIEKENCIIQYDVTIAES